MKTSLFNCTLLVALASLPFASSSQKPVWHIDISQRGLLLADTSISVHDTIIDHFVGQWCWKKGDSIVEFDFAKIKHDFGNSEYSIEMDLIVGGYKVLVGKKEIVNTISTKTLQGNSEGIPNSLFFYISDNIKFTRTKLVFKKVDDNKIWLEIGKRGEWFPSDKNLPFPTNIIFMRKK
jgi:hypothetical protein